MGLEGFDLWPHPCGRVISPIAYKSNSLVLKDQIIIDLKDEVHCLKTLAKVGFL